MTKPVAFSVVVATDGSRPARAAIKTAMAFPWPEGTHVGGVVARRTPATSGRPGYVLAAYDRHWNDVAARARRALRARFPGVEVEVVDDTPAEAILAEAKRRDADVTVVGWRGHGTFRRLFIGSVSREVVRRAASAVLVVRSARATVRRFVVAVDGSPSSAHAVDMLARLATPRGGQVTVVGVVEPVTLPSLAMMPASVRAPLRREAATLDKAETAAMRRTLDAAVRKLTAAGWKARAVLRRGAPLTEILAAVDAAEADVLALGTRGTGGVERLLLGSVAEGALGRARVPVLVTP
jgi:nucleotide-binding universal stress UspA family protein